MPDITGELGTGATGTTEPTRAVPLSGWFSRGLFASMTGVLASCAVGTPVANVTGGDEILAASASSVDINAAIALALDGDTVRVPAGNATWTSDVTVPSTKGVAVIGAGVGLTNINMGTYHVYLYTRQTNSRVRLSGFSFTNAPVGGLTINNYDMGAINWRVDHCRWDSCTTANIIRVLGYTFGLFDNCTWWNCYRPLWIDQQYSAYDLAGYPGPVPYPGAYSWTQPLDQGGPTAVYFEDCEVHNDASDIFFNCRQGARFVWRHNRMTGAAQQLQTHGGCTPGARNPRWLEIYENSWEETVVGAFGNPAYWSRGMNGIVFGNEVSTVHPSAFMFDYEPACPRYPGTTCNGFWPVPGYIQVPAVPETFFVYPAQDQIGVGIDTGLGTDQSLDEAKLLGWDNRRAGVYQPMVFSSCELSASLIQENRDFYQYNAGFLASPTTGIGTGLLANRPSSGMVAGVYYWATDTRTLYKATNSTTWAVWYTPYPYPHPLTVS